MHRPTTDKDRKPRVLLVEDNPGDALLVREILKKAYDVCHAASLAETIAHIKSDSTEPSDVVLLDLSLPDSQGLETLQAVLSCVDCPVVILSGLSDVRLAEEAVSLGAHDYLPKGHITHSALVRVLFYTLERERQASERLHLESDLAQSRKLEAVGQLAAGIAHEINTPTQYVSDNTRFVRESLTDVIDALNQLKSAAMGGAPLGVDELTSILDAADVAYLTEELPKALDESLEGLANITRIVNAMKQFSHPARADKTSIDVNASLETSMVVASNEWKYVAEVAWDLDRSLPTIQGLHGELNQVFLNLIVNAAHAVSDKVGDSLDERGLITVRTLRIGDDQVGIVIEDTGCGIAPENLQQVFDPFFTTKDVGRGTGQGLAITHDVIANKHNGSVTIESQVGQGTAFKITLPIQAEIPAGATGGGR